MNEWCERIGITQRHKGHGGEAGLRSRETAKGWRSVTIGRVWLSIGRARAAFPKDQLSVPGKFLTIGNRLSRAQSRVHLPLLHSVEERAGERRLEIVNEWCERIGITQRHRGHGGEAGLRSREATKRWRNHRTSLAEYWTGSSSDSQGSIVCPRKTSDVM